MPAPDDDQRAPSNLVLIERAISSVRLTPVSDDELSDGSEDSGRSGGSGRSGHSQCSTRSSRGVGGGRSPSNESCANVNDPEVVRQHLRAIGKHLNRQGSGASSGSKKSTGSS